MRALYLFLTLLISLNARVINFNIMTTKDYNIVPETWHYVGQNGEPPFLNGVVNYGGNWGELRFIKLDNGVVVIEGLVKNVEKDKVIFTLPEGYRPTQKVIFIVSRGAESAGRIDIDTSGNLISRGAKTGYLSLTGISFVAK